MIKFSTERLIIRQFIESDKDALTLIIAEPEVMRFSLNGPITIEQAREQLRNKDIAHYENDGYGLWALIHKQDKALIGFAGLLIQNIDGEQKIEISYRLHPSYWKQGLAIEATKAIVHYAFTELKLDSLIAIIDPANINSIKVAEKLGMSFFKNTIFHSIAVSVYQLYNPHSDLNI